MLKKLKQKFVCVSMIAVFLVLLAIMGTINILNYRSTKQSADQLLNILEDNQGSFPPSHEGELNPAAPDNVPDKKPDKPENDDHPKDTLSPEAPFNTRYFTVTLTLSDGAMTVSDTNVSYIAAISTETAEEYASALCQKGKTEGYQGNYRYRQTTLSEGSIMYIFLDCERDLHSFHNFLYASIFISLTGLLFIFILLILFSGIAVRPIAESYEKQKRFITDASHEIKTPLTIIDANTDVIEMETGASAWTTSTKKQIERLTFLTEKLVLLSKMDEEQPRMEMITTNISEILTDVAASFEGVCTARGKAITVFIEPDVMLRANSDALKQAFTLLIDNAVKYSNSNGNIRISCKRKGHAVKLIFENSVEHIEPGRHNELFERFYRPDASRNTESGGFGIGLSTVKAIVEAHKGKITVESEDAHSIRFTLTLPL